MNATFLLTAALMAATPQAAQAPAAPVDETESVRALLARLVPDDAPLPSAKKAPATVEAAAPAPSTKTNAMASPIIEPERMAHTTMLLLVALIGALGVATLASRKRTLSSRPLRRLAAESLGARQQIVLVEALGEYLLVATGGREPVLLAQLDTAQAKRRLDAMNEPVAPAPAPTGFLANLFSGKLPHRRTRFESVLAEVEAEPTPTPALTGDLTKAQAALRYIAAANAAPQAAFASVPAPSLDATLEQLAAAKRASANNRNEEIRRRLASL